MSAWIPLTPLLCVALGGLLVMVADVVFKKAPDYAFIASGALFLAVALSCTLWSHHQDYTLPAFFGNYLAVDRLALFFDVVICGGAALCTLLAGAYLREHDLERGEFYVLILFSTFGAMVLARATDLLSVFIGLETMSLGVYSLVAYRRSSIRSAEGGIKYFLLGSFAAAIFLFGSALLYGATGSTELVAIGRQISQGSADTRLVMFAMVFLIVGVAFKVSAVPFHMWTPDAYEGAVTPVSSYMSVVVKAAAFALMARIVLVVFGDPLSSNFVTGWPSVIAVLAALSLIVGNLSAIVQRSVKRMLAYSSIGHAGFILMGIAASTEMGDAALSSVFYYLMAYTVSNVLAFGSLILMGSRGKEAVSYEDLAGVGLRHPLAALPLTVAMLSLMGMPPTAGFFAKYYVLSAAVSMGGVMTWLAVLGVLSSAVAAYYYLRVLVFAYMKSPEPGAPIAVPMRSGYVVVGLLVAAFFVIKMGITPQNYLDWAIEAAGRLV
ncbi:MAG: NADH-quinone oxidoreductase subunit N [Myxococcales bacterium]|nr:MAG: NADH-quinone oxidoreductase subunit N [Myxococcales bacterium]